MVMAIKWARRSSAKDKRGSTDLEPTAEVVDDPAGPDVTEQVTQELIVLADLATGPAVALQVRRVLALLGIEEVSPDLGTPFDAEEHHVVATVEDDERSAGEIVEVVRPGWSQAGVLIRPAEVSVVVDAGVSIDS